MSIAIRSRALADDVLLALEAYSNGGVDKEELAEDWSSGLLPRIYDTLNLFAMTPEAPAAVEVSPSLALIEEAFREGFCSTETYNDTLLNTADEAWAKECDYYATKLATRAPTPAAVEVSRLAEPARDLPTDAELEVVMRRYFPRTQITAAYKEIMRDAVIVDRLRFASRASTASEPAARLVSGEAAQRLRNLQTWLVCREIGNALAPSLETVQGWLLGLGDITGEAPPEFVMKTAKRDNLSPAANRLVQLTDIHEANDTGGLLDVSGAGPALDEVAGATGEQP